MPALCVWCQDMAWRNVQSKQIATNVKSLNKVEWQPISYALLTKLPCNYSDNLIIDEISIGLLDEDV